MIQNLNKQVFGKPSKHATLLIAHGLFGSGRNWRAIANRLSRDRQVITVDMRNHGDSFWSNSHSYADMASDLASMVGQIGGPVDVLGHSMGGKAAMFLALQNPTNMNRLIVADIAPVTYTHSQMPNIKIMQNLEISQFTRRSEIENAINEHLNDAATSAFLAQNFIISEQGNSWKINLKALAYNMDKIMGFPNVSTTFHNDTIFIIGNNSDYVQAKHYNEIDRLFPNHKIHSIKGAGHWVHAEAPREFIQTVIDFLNHPIANLT